MTNPDFYWCCTVSSLEHNPMKQSFSANQIMPISSIQWLAVHQPRGDFLQKASQTILVFPASAGLNMTAIWPALCGDNFTVQEINRWVGEGSLSQKFLQTAAFTACSSSPEQWAIGPVWIHWSYQNVQCAWRKRRHKPIHSETCWQQIYLPPGRCCRGKW